MRIEKIVMFKVDMNQEHVGKMHNYPRHTQRTAAEKKQGSESVWASSVKERRDPEFLKGGGVQGRKLLERLSETSDRITTKCQSKPSRKMAWCPGVN